MLDSEHTDVDWIALGLEWSSGSRAVVERSSCCEANGAQTLALFLVQPSFVRCGNVCFTPAGRPPPRSSLVQAYICSQAAIPAEEEVAEEEAEEEEAEQYQRDE